MKAKNILTAYDFTEPFYENWIKKEMGVIGLRLRKELLGESVLGIEEPATKKSIAITRSFPKQLTDFDALRERISTFASVCAEKLRAQNSCCHTIVVMLGTMEHKTPTVKQYYNEAITLPFGTDSTLTINQTAIKILENLYEKHKGQRFQKAGVIVTQLININEKQLHLFEEENPKHHLLMKAIDNINQKIGDRKVKLGTQDAKTWNMKQNMLSPRYTTQLDEILVVKCH